MDKTLSIHSKEKYIKIVISFLVAVIDMVLAANLERGMLPDKRPVLGCLLFAGVALFTAVIYHFLLQGERRLYLHAAIWGLLMTTAYVLGCLMRRDGTALADIGKLPGLLLTILCLTVPAAACISLFLRGFPGLGKLPGRARPGKKEYSVWQVRLFYLLAILLCWFPVFLAYYPSVFAYDAEGQLYQVIAGDYSTHHPLLHTLFLGAFFRLGGNVLGSYSAGMAVHSVVQMLLMAAAFAYILSYLYQKRTSVYLRIILLIFYALFPVNSILALSTTKDVLFSALVLLYTIGLYRMVCDGKKTGMGRRDLWIWLAITVLMLLMRNNAVYALLVSVPVVCIGLRGKNGLWKRYLLLSVIGLGLFAAAHAGLKAATGAGNGSPREMLSIPLQQMARTRVKEEETLSPQMRQELDAYLSSEWVFAAYNPHLADPVKLRAVIHDNPAGFLRTWLQLGLEHPQTYIDAFLDNSIGYWFLEDRTHAEIYGIGTESGFGYLSTDNRTMPAGCEIIEHSYLPGLRSVMEEIVSENAYQKIPVIRILFAPAFYWWLLCLYLAVAIYRRQYRLILPAMFLVVYYLTLLLSPTVLIRYMYPFVVTVPAICCCLYKDLVEKNCKNIQ